MLQYKGCLLDQCFCCHPEGQRVTLGQRWFLEFLRNYHSGWISQLFHAWNGKTYLFLKTRTISPKPWSAMLRLMSLHNTVTFVTEHLRGIATISKWTSSIHDIFSWYLCNCERIVCDQGRPLSRCNRCSCIGPRASGAPRHAVWIDYSFLPDAPCASDFSRNAI